MTQLRHLWGDRPREGNDYCSIRGGIMIKNRSRSSIVELEARHCPAAPAHAKLETPRESSPEMRVGKAIHALRENVALQPGALAVDVVDAACLAIGREGITFEDQKPEFPRIDEILEARGLALDSLDRYPIPGGELLVEREVNLDPVDWSIAEPEECILCCGMVEEDKECPCGGTGQRWKPHWHQILDLVSYRQEEYPGDGSEVMVAEGLDGKGWNLSSSWLETTQGKGYFVSMAALHPDAEILRVVGWSYRMKAPETWEIDLRTEEGVDQLQRFRDDLKTAIEVDQARGTDIEALAQPGAGCFAGYGGCPFFARCEPAKKRASELEWRLGRPADEALSLNSIEASATAYAIFSAARQAADGLFKGYGGGPIQTPTGHWVGWKGRVGRRATANAPMLLGEQYARYVLHRPNEAEKVAGVFAALGIGSSVLGAGRGAAAVDQILARLEHAKMDEDRLRRLRELCFEATSGRSMAIWRGKPPEPEAEAPDGLLEQLQASIKSQTPTEGDEDEQG